MSSAVHAATIHIDVPNLVLTRPASGSLNFSFTGSYSVAPGALSEIGLLYPTTGGSNYKTINLNLATDPFTTPSFSGTLWTGSIDSNTPLGYYGFAGSSTTVASNFYLIDDTGRTLAPFSITVQAVPEPTTMAALGLGVVALVRRRKRS